MESFLTLDSSTKISYKYFEGKKDICVVFMHGTLSDKNSSKSLFLEECCHKWGLSYIAFDFLGHGSSSGKYIDGTIGKWFDNAKAVIQFILNKNSKEKIILVGSSMGGWISLLCCKEYKENISAFIGLATAPDFTKELDKEFTNEQKQEMKEKGVIYIPNGWTEEGDPWTYELMQDALKYLVLNGKNSINFNNKVVLIHGTNDDCVPLSKSFEIIDSLTSNDVKLIVLKNSTHRLAEQSDFNVLEQELIKIIENI
ncbi:MAG: alpha/beta hydrolase [Alphaproteobacteria bacterium]|nr:alpha/beta hydrolase [Alphaproteobacteria bacterium]